MPEILGTNEAGSGKLFRGGTSGPDEGLTRRIAAVAGAPPPSPSGPADGATAPTLHRAVRRATIPLRRGQMKQVYLMREDDARFAYDLLDEPPADLPGGLGRRSSPR